jgi:hypothetical protein
VHVFFFHGEAPNEFLVAERDGTWNGNVPKARPADAGAPPAEEEK